MISVREHGRPDASVVIVLHGGPGAPGYMRPVAERLGAWFHVLEPMQRGSGPEPLTVSRHVADLDDLIDARCTGRRPSVLGHSWGAMLALAYAAARPGRAGSIVLVGCGTFDLDARHTLRRTLDRRMTGPLRRRLESLETECPDPDERLKRAADLTLPLYSHDPTAGRLECESCDARAYEESWNDMIRLQEAGLYPAAFRAIREPVLMLHGADDPHPGTEIARSLEPHLPHLEYRQWARCGHYPWLERAVADEFFMAVRDWLRTSVNR